MVKSLLVCLVVKNMTKYVKRNIIIKNKWTTIVREKNYIIVEREPALMVIPVIREGGAIYTYLVKQYRYQIGKEVWQFPMGTLEKKADPKKHAKKELEEETGLRTNKITFVGNYYIDPGLSRQQCYVYLAEEIIEGGKQKLEETEAGMITKCFSLAELETLVADNQLTDGWIYPALYFLKQFLKQN